MKNKKVFILAFISFILLISIFKWINYLFTNNYLNSVEGYEDRGSPTTSHTVNLPLTTTYSCKNMCGPTARCSITGQQCTADIDCPGCNPYSPSLNQDSDVEIPGQNDAGKMTGGVTPTYSTLTTDFGTQAKLITSNKFEKPSMPNFGVDTWSSQFNKDQQQFDDRYKPSDTTNTPSYSNRYSLTGQFIEEGPLGSNSYLN
jgi:hypothetical protein